LNSHSYYIYIAYVRRGRSAAEHEKLAADQKNGPMKSRHRRLIRYQVSKTKVIDKSLPLLGDCFLITKTRGSYLFRF
jgi:hypothetical protein